MPIIVVNGKKYEVSQKSLDKCGDNVKKQPDGTYVGDEFVEFVFKTMGK